MLARGPRGPRPIAHGLAATARGYRRDGEVEQKSEAPGLNSRSLNGTESLPSNISDSEIFVKDNIGVRHICTARPRRLRSRLWRQGEKKASAQRPPRRAE